MGTRPAIFKWRQTEPGIILCAVRWYLRYSLSLRDVEELLAERGLSVDHTTVWRWVQYCGPARWSNDCDVLASRRNLRHSRKLYLQMRLMSPSYLTRISPRKTSEGMAFLYFPGDVS